MMMETDTLVHTDGNVNYTILGGESNADVFLNAEMNTFVNVVMPPTGV